MITPPSTEAVEAAIVWIRGGISGISAEQMRLLHGDTHNSMGSSWNASRILAAEVERLRVELGYTEDLIRSIRRRCKASAICVNEDILKMTEEFNQDEE